MNDMVLQQTGPYPPPRPGTDDDIDQGLAQRRYYVRRLANIFVGLGAAPADKTREASIESAINVLKDELASQLKIDEDDAAVLFRAILAAYNGMETVMGEWAVPRALGEIAHMLWILVEINEKKNTA